MMTVKELAEKLGLRVQNATEHALSGAAPLESAGPTDLSFVSHNKFFEQAMQSNAGCLIVPEDYPGRRGQVLLRVANPRAVFAAALRFLYPAREPRPGIHRSAVIEDSAEVDDTCEIGPNVTVGA